MAAKKLKLEEVVASTVVWALVFPDGKIDPQWFYPTRKDLKQFAPAQLFGDTSGWLRAHGKGYRARKLYLSLTPVDAKSAVAKSGPAVGRKANTNSAASAIRAGKGSKKP